MQNRVTGPYGHFVAGEPATYEINSLAMETSWEYIYQNRDILLRVDQFGPISVQAHPPGDIILLKREKDDKCSKWLVWLQSERLNGGIPFTNFCRPVVGGNPNVEPEKLSILFYPHQAVYTWVVDGLRVTTTFFVPDSGSDIHMALELENLGDSPLSLRATPVLAPYVNPAQLAPWDKPEWYLKTGFGMEKAGIFWSQLFNAASQKEKRRTATLWTTGEALADYEVSLEKFLGAGDWSNPQAIYGSRLRLGKDTCAGYGVYTGENEVCGYPSVWCARYALKLEPGEKRLLQQVLSMPENNADCTLQTLEEVRGPLSLFHRAYLEAQKDVRRRFFTRLFSERSIQTADPLLDDYVNSWLPLQMYWVASLDRGWPTGMRGTRDCANDFMGELPLEPRWAREMLLLLFQCQRTDGWFPRQVSTQGRRGSHDLRPFVDGGVFVLEFLNEYLCHTGDSALLAEKLPWLDREDADDILTHSLRAAEYYVTPENLGGHGLCKIRGGDWLDAVNRAGLEGRGESVMVTCQVVMAIEYLCEIAAKLRLPQFDFKFWRGRQESLRQAVREYAYNEEGFFNGVFTDAGQWVFSSADPDGECRPYICSNAYAVISGVAVGEMARSTLRALKTLEGPWGYRLFAPPIGMVPIEKVGRSGSGDGPMGLFENGTPYNHGSHGFLGRALAAAGEADELLRVLYYMLPFDPACHPPEWTLTPPYAMVNCWQEVKPYEGRGGMLFLTGSIAMALRMVYSWLLGVRHTMDGLELSPCCSAKLGAVSAEFSARGSQVMLHIRPGGDTLRLNGKPVTKTRRDPFTGRPVYFVPYEALTPCCTLEWGGKSNTILSRERAGEALLAKL